MTKTIKKTVLGVSLTFSSLFGGGDPFLGEVTMFAGNFAPRGWAFCNGQLLAINSNQALFSLLGTTYGGDGRTTFGLPDLRGRAPVHAGHGLGLTNINQGVKSGTENINLPYTSVKTVNSTEVKKGRSVIDNVDTLNRTVNTSTTPISIRAPYTAVQFIIATQGIFPSRN